MAMNVSAEDKSKKGKGAKLNPAYQQLLADLKLTDEQKPKFQALQEQQSAFMAEQKKRSAEEKRLPDSLSTRRAPRKLRNSLTKTNSRSGGSIKPSNVQRGRKNLSRNIFLIINQAASERAAFLMPSKNFRTKTTANIGALKRLCPMRNPLDVCFNLFNI